jgi:hypothetical protein
MSDLISRQALLNDFRNTITEQSGTMDWLNLINRQPVAYDADKVVEQLENASCKDIDGYDLPIIDLDVAIKIVKGAVKDE